MRRALIIGAGGQDGRLLTELLLGRQYVVEGWTRRTSREPLRCKAAAVDLLHPAEVERELARLAPDEIYYLAAFHHSTEDTVELTPSQLFWRSFDVHAVGLLNVLHAMKTTHPAARLFNAASSHVFGAGEERRLDEKSPLRPNSAYGMSKAAGLRCGRLYRDEEGLFVATGILFNHESSLRREAFLSQKIVRGALRAQQDPTSRLTLGNLEARVDWGYAPDYVAAMHRILQLDRADDFVVASGELHSVREFAQIAFRAVGLDWRQYVVTDSSLLRKSPLTLCGDPTKLERASGWRRSVTFEEMVNRLVAQAMASDACGRHCGRCRPVAAATLMASAA